MCELLGMSANVPTDICFSFTGLIRRGGATGPHRDGWGVAFYEGRGCRTFHEPRACAESDLAQVLRGYSIKSQIVVCHIRKATHGQVCLENTHPFGRELWGRPWTFAHNGKLKGIKRRPLTHYRPIGGTDSEHAFCWMLDQLRARHAKPPGSLVAVRRQIAELAADLAQLGTFNMLLSDGRLLYAFCTTRLTWLTRQAPFGPATLVDDDVSVDFAAETTPDDIVTVIATQPLTRDETWTTMPPGALLAFRDGVLIP
ncbi:MAG: class II glutamine amidotransferase [Azospirillum sp.]|nr:class II glutamine amidotransferase [Azospirillum sp.]